MFFFFCSFSSDTLSCDWQQDGQKSTITASLLGTVHVVQALDKVGNFFIALINVNHSVALSHLHSTWFEKRITYALEYINIVNNGKFSHSFLYEYVFFHNVTQFAKIHYPWQRRGLREHSSFQFSSFFALDQNRLCGSRMKRHSLLGFMCLITAIVALRHQ